ncbi:transposase [Thermodesulfobacteriota bacterium]
MPHERANIWRGRTLASSAEFRLRMVRLFLEEGYSAILLREQFGVSGHSIRRWVRAYPGDGAEELDPHFWGNPEV